MDVYLIIIIAVIVVAAIVFLALRKRPAKSVPDSGDDFEYPAEPVEGPAPVGGVSPPLHELSTLPEADKQRLMNAVWYQCENPHCNHSKFLSVHHIISEVEGGNGLNNLVVLCSVCHTAAHKNEIPVEELYSWIKNRPERLKFDLEWSYR